jgi:multicomponent Na+:H+ antiporter subunit D
VTSLVALPVLLPLLAAAFTLMLGRSAMLQRLLSVLVLAAIVTSAAILLSIVDSRGPVVLQLGGYAPPFGITLIADRLSALLLLVSSVVTLAVLIYSIGQRITDYGRDVSSTAFHPMYLMLSAGVSLAYLSGDLFNLFVAFEIMLSASYVLITRRITANRVRAGMTYTIVSLTSSLLFLTMIALVYAATGTVNLADLSEKAGALPPVVQTGMSLLMIVVFGVKAAMVPLHFWLPDSYPNAPVAVTAVFAGLLTKVGVYALIRTQTLVFDHQGPLTVLLVIAMATMLVGGFGAIVQDDLNRLLSFLLVSHIGYMLFGLALFSRLGMTGVILYVVHHITVQAGLFLVGGLVTRQTGTVSLHGMSGVSKSYPLIAALFALPALSLAGVPPFSGFVAKIVLLQAGVASGSVMGYLLSAAAIVASLLTLYAMARVWVLGLWGKPAEPHADPDPNDDVIVGTASTSRTMTSATGILVAAGVLIALLAGPLAGISERAAAEVMDPGRYRAAVLGEAAR